MLVGSGTSVPTTPVAGPQLSQMMSTANGDRIEPGGFVDNSTSWNTDEKPPTRVTVKVKVESVPAPPPWALNNTPYSNVPKPSMPMLDGFPEFTNV